MNEYEQLLIQTNENLRTTDNKRDQTFYFFIVLFGLYLNFYKDINIDHILSIFVNISLIIFGTAIIFVIINYQMWHTIYVNTAIIYQKVINRKIKGPLDRNKINELYNEKNKLKYFSKFSTEFWLFNAILIINFLLIVMLINRFFNEKILSACCIVVIILILIIYFYLFNLIRIKKIKKAQKNFIEISWMLRL